LRNRILSKGLVQDWCKISKRSNFLPKWFSGVKLSVIPKNGQRDFFLCTTSIVLIVFGMKPQPVPLQIWTRAAPSYISIATCRWEKFINCWSAASKVIKWHFSRKKRIFGGDLVTEPWASEYDGHTKTLTMLFDRSGKENSGNCQASIKSNF
jgi:hypothetical protein